MVELQIQDFELPDGHLRYLEGFVTEHQQLSVQLQQSLDWYQGNVRVYGKVHQIPRLQCWYGDKSYTYSQVRLEPRTWPPLLLRLRERVEQASGYEFNSVLGNWYQHGQHGMGFHADNEPELGPDPVVAVLTFGYARELKFRHINGRDKFAISPASGSLLLMEGNIQRYWRHGIGKTTRIVDGRISLTFRKIV